MKPQDLIRAAAGILNTVGWTHGKDQKGQVVHARNVKGDPIPLYRGDNSGADKARVNPDAVAFSIYGALVKAMDDARGKVASPGLMWLTLQQVAIASGAPRPGGTNYVHPLLQINELEGQTLDGVLAYLELAAVTIETNPDPETAEPSPASKALASMNSFAAGKDTGLVQPTIKSPASQAIEAPHFQGDDIIFNAAGSFTEPALNPFAPPTPEQMANSITVEAGETIKVEGDGVIQRIKDDPEPTKAAPVEAEDDGMPPLGDD